MPTTTKSVRWLLPLALFMTAVIFHPWTAGKLFSDTGEVTSFELRVLLHMASLFFLILALAILFFPHQTIAFTSKKYKEIMLFFGAILLSLAAAEIMIGFFSYDLHYGGITFQRDYEVHNYEFNYTVHLNSDGFRDDEFRKKKEEGTTRVLLIGDSFVFGLGVGGNETIDKLLEKKFQGQRHVDVFNAGAPGLNLKQYADIAEELEPYGPDVVILSLYVDNDIFKDNDFSKEKQQRTVIEETVHWALSLKLIQLLKALDTKEDCVFAWIHEYDIDNYYWDMMCKGVINPYLLQRTSVGDNDLYYLTLSELFDTIPDTKENILLVRDTYKDARFILLINPSKYQFNTTDFEILREIGFIFGKTPVNKKIQDAIVAWADIEGIEHVDMLPPMERKNDRFFHPIDDHYNGKGNALVSEILFNKLNKPQPGQELQSVQ